MKGLCPVAELAVSRFLAAPRPAVWRALTDPDLLAAWFGPVGFSVPRDTVDVDVRVGGHQRLVMVSDDDPSVTSPVDATFTEVVPGEVLAGEETLPGGAVMTLRQELADEGDGTRLTLRQGPFADELVGPATAGWESAWTRLDGLLADGQRAS
ncbi:SRPBCC family protein [Spirilliplanes yamanashiensis]|uniref:Activator of Hsp90 ATPase homologue 1/2-like C-terminal domain-containing protein n=1 Tax=Spirilliplanes yamanashiensis TaxID=42233 RepID=A0A8J3Y5Z5_9ACTN|nr:SRPBCC domain-containing protein [Spirilliplanes yamanashiensis]MDP9814512.1 uncharacterized protein YndB with AHSA1/START domain [Spirilliplanes yamanashiensis]GIJ02165.1 hypothetical protein Sya03_15170 [Spirilliplanes yamanashiensis]